MKLGRNNHHVRPALVAQKDGAVVLLAELARARQALTLGSGAALEAARIDWLPL